MAYDSNSGGTVGLRDMCPVFGLPGVISQVLNNSASATDVLVDIPWKTCRLAAAYTVVTTAIDADTGGMQVTLELNAAGGGDMMAIDIAASSAVGDQDYATFSTGGRARCNNLDRDDTARDKINIEIDGSTTGTGQAMLHMFFEPANNE
jgi:hypothetical protein